MAHDSYKVGQYLTLVEALRVLYFDPTFDPERTMLGAGTGGGAAGRAAESPSLRGERRGPDGRELFYRSMAGKVEVARLRLGTDSIEVAGVQ